MDSTHNSGETVIEMQQVVTRFGDHVVQIFCLVS